MKEEIPMTAHKLKMLLDQCISDWLSKKGKSKIPLSKFKSDILTQFDSKIFDQYSITLYKNCKTTKVKDLYLFEYKGTLKGPKPKITIGSLTSGSLTSVAFLDKKSDEIKPWKSFSPTSKSSKKIIMEGKMKMIVKFHVERKHNEEWGNCLACKVIRAFVQWEFHSPIVKNLGNKDKDFSKMLEIQEKIIKEASSLPQVKSAFLYKKSEEEKGLNFYTEDDLLFDEEDNGIN